MTEENLSWVAPQGGYRKAKLVSKPWLAYRRSCMFFSPNASYFQTELGKKSVRGSVFSLGPFWIFQACYPPPCSNKNAKLATFVPDVVWDLYSFTWLLNNYTQLCISQHFYKKCVIDFIDFQNILTSHAKSKILKIFLSYLSRVHYRSPHFDYMSSFMHIK